MKIKNLKYNIINSIKDQIQIINQNKNKIKYQK